MILAFLEDGTLELHETEAAAVAAYEGVDVESGVVSFYADDGTPLAPEFTARNRHGKLLGLLRWSESGAYRLVPSVGGTADALWLALLEHPHLAPNARFATLEALKAHLAARGAVVERP